MKKLLVWAVLSVLTLSLVGCGLKEKIEDKVAEAAGEKIIEDAGGGDVNIDGDKVEINGDNGEKMVIGATEWPDSDLIKNIPEFKNGTVISVVDTQDTVMVSMEKVEKEDFSTYLEEIKNAYVEDPYESTSDGLVTYGASNADGITVALFYMEEDQTMSINVAKSQE